MKIAGRVLVVTGAGSGIGREVVLEALRRGSTVAAVDINESALAKTTTLAASGYRLSSHAVNIADRAAVEALPGRLEARHGAVDGLIHCAGIIQPFVKLPDLDYDAVERVFSVNWWGTLYLTKTFLPVLIPRPEAHIVNVSSMGGFLPVPGQTVYGASKAAVKLLTEGLHAECAGTNVHVTVVFPGAIATDIAAHSGVAIPTGGAQAQERRRRITQPVKAAHDILDGVERNAYRVLVGRDAKLMDALCRLEPRRAAGIVAGQMKGLLADEVGRSMPPVTPGT